MNTKKYLSIVASSLLISGALAGTVLAEENKPPKRPLPTIQRIITHTVVGKVTAVSGNTFTISSAKGGQKENTTYTVDATNAEILKKNVKSAITDITINDNLVIEGTITGTNVVAKRIRATTPVERPEGNGQPVIAGTVSAISGSTVTVKTGTNISYTVDATSAKITKREVNSPTISDIAVGDKVIVQGAVNGTSVTASTIIDSGVTKESEKSQSDDGLDHSMKPFFSGIGNFFKKLFGF